MSRRLPENHYCIGCCWGKFQIDRVVCPFVEGSCARVPRTINEPDRDRIQTRNHQPVVVIDKASAKRDVDYPRRFTVDGIAHTLHEWAEIKGIVESTLRHRVWEGWRVSDAIERGIEDAAKSATSACNQENDEIR